MPASAPNIGLDPNRPESLSAQRNRATDSARSHSSTLTAGKPMARLPKSLARKSQSLFEPPGKVDTSRIYCGDNLDILQRMPANSIDLVYIDPPFNSNRNYEVFWGETKEKRAFEDRHESTRAYIEFMRPRCVELARVLKKSGSFYYHCDWHASHYVKVMLDQIFGENNFRNEIIWKRADTHNDAKVQFPVVNDSIFYYAASNATQFNPQFGDYPEKTMKEWYQYLEFPSGETRRMTSEESQNQTIPSSCRRFNVADMSAPAGGGMAAINKKTGKPNGWYVYKGFQPPERGWRYSPDSMSELDSKGLLLFPKNPDGRIMRKRYLDEQPGPVVGNVWVDIPQIRAHDKERLGYPTQKPLALLDRIIRASSNPSDIILDAFCGCGTALASAQNLQRRWVGIDFSPTACRVMAERLRKDCGLSEGKNFYVVGLPRDEKQLRAMPHFEFENWAVVALGGVPNRAKVGDMGIDGRIYPVSSISSDMKKLPGQFDFMDIWYPVQVKQQDKVGRPDIDKFEAVMTRENRTKGFFVAFDYTRDALQEAESFFRKQKRLIVPLTVKKILEDEAELVRILF